MTGAFNRNNYGAPPFTPNQQFPPSTPRGGFTPRGRGGMSRQSPSSQSHNTVSPLPARRSPIEEAGEKRKS